MVLLRETGKTSTEIFRSKWFEARIVLNLCRYLSHEQIVHPAVFTGSEFVTGWTGKRGRKLKSKLEKTKQKVKSMARELYDDHFKAVESMPRGVVVTLRNIATQLESAWELHINRQVHTAHRRHQSHTCVFVYDLKCLRWQCLEGENTWRDLMKTALENLIVVLKDENTISPYEMCSSGLVQALFTVLSNVSV